jgi:hypothetical protein
MKQQLPRHVLMVPSRGGGPAHNVIVPAFLGSEPRLYTIDLAFAPDRKSYAFRYTRHVTNPGSAQARTPRVAIGGSGAQHLIQSKKKWMRSLLRVVKAHDRGDVSSQTVADHLAGLNHEVHLGTRDGSVGPRCIVAWRHKKSGIHRGGGAQQFYTNTTRDANSPALPTIGQGMDIAALAKTMAPHLMEMFKAMREGRPAKELDKDEINAELARLPDKPDEDLR